MAPRLFDLAQQGCSTVQVVVSMVVITLFVPCIANFHDYQRVRRTTSATGVAATVFPLALLVGGMLNIVPARSSGKDKNN